MTFAPGDRVHLAGLGTGIIREARGAARFAVEIKGRVVVAAAGDLELADPPSKPRKHRAIAPAAPSRPALSERSESKGTRSHPAAPAAPSRTQPHPVAPGAPGASLDLHGKTVDEAIAAVEVWVNDVLLAGHGEARVIHGRSGGRLKLAVHRYLRGVHAVASYRIDPQNPGVTIVTFA